MASSLAHLCPIEMSEEPGGASLRPGMALAAIARPDRPPTGAASERGAILLR